MGRSSGEKGLRSFLLVLETSSVCVADAGEGAVNGNRQYTTLDILS